MPHSEMKIAGDSTYAPPEALYGYTDPDWNTRRYGNDVYQLGSLMVFMIVDIPISILLLKNLKEEYHPAHWSGTYEQVLPYIGEAFITSIGIIEKNLPDNEFKIKIITIIKELCEPSVFKRGDPILRQRNSNPFNMERYISRFDLLAKKLEYKIYRH